MVIQIYYDLALYSMAEIAYSPLWSSSEEVVIYSHVVTVIMFIGVIVIPPIILIGHMKAGQGVWGRAWFVQKFGALLDGSTRMVFSITGRRQSHLLIPPILFFLRRFIYTAFMVWLQSPIF